VGPSKQLKISLDLSFWYANQAKQKKDRTISNVNGNANANGNKKFSNNYGNKKVATARHKKREIM